VEEEKLRKDREKIIPLLEAHIPSVTRWLKKYESQLQDVECVVQREALSRERRRRLFRSTFSPTSSAVALLVSGLSRWRERGRGLAC
jgi:hypothetical protein